MAESFVSPFKTDAEARRALEDAGWVACIEFRGDASPDWTSTTISQNHLINSRQPFVVLEGSFTREQLFAILHFYPEETPDVG